MVDANYIDHIALVLLLFTLFTLVSVAIYFDCYQRRIPNRLTFGGVIGGVLLNTFLTGYEGLLFSLGGMLIAGAFLIPGYALGKTGAGDVKLLGAVGAFIGPYSAVVAAAVSIIVGGIMALLYALFAQGSSPWSRYGLMLRCFFTTGHVVYTPPPPGDVMASTFPFAPAIACGAFIGCYYYLQHANPIVKLV